jgi:hypothetical protein
VIASVLTGVVLVLLLVVCGWLAVLTNQLLGLRGDVDALTAAPDAARAQTAPIPAVTAPPEPYEPTTLGQPPTGRHRPSPRPRTGVAP